jgi:DNA-binding transcriptional regulator YhcF (GntR family)
MHGCAARALVQVVDVLRDDADLGVVLPGGNGAVAGIGFDGADQVMPPEIPSPHAFGVALPALNTGQLVRVETGPQPVLVVAERRHAAFGGDSRAGQDRDAHPTKIAGLRDTEQVELGEWLQVDGQAGRPLFDQLRNQIIEAIRAGTLAPGTRLPTVRELAGQLGLAVNTVARAYRELEAAGVVETRGRFGTFVARADPSDTAMADAARAYLDVARGLGLGKADAVRYLEAAYDV